MARTGPRLDGNERRLVRFERCLGRIQIVEKNLVEAEIASDGYIFAGNSGDEVRVRSGLPAFIDARAMMLNH